MSGALLGLPAQVVVDPARTRMNVQLVHMAVDIDEVHVLAAVAAPVPVERGAGEARTPWAIAMTSP